MAGPLRCFLVSSEAHCSSYSILVHCCCSYRSASKQTRGGWSSVDDFANTLILRCRDPRSESRKTLA